MKKLISFLSLLIVGIAANAQTFGNFSMDPSHCLKMGNSALEMQVWNENWSNAATKKNFKNDDGYPKIVKGKSYETRGILLLNGKSKAEYGETFNFTSKDTCEFSVFFKPPSDFKFRGANMYITLPYREYKEGIFLEGKPFDFGENPVTAQVTKSLPEAKLVGAKGVIRLMGEPLRFLLQDNRRFKGDSASIRLNLNRDSEGVYKASFRIKYAPHQFERIDLSKIAKSKLEAGNLPRGKVSFGVLTYSIPSTDDCVEIPAGGEIELPIKSKSAGALYILSAFESKEPLTGDVAEITPLGEGVGGGARLSAQQVNAFSDDSVKSIWRTIPAGGTLRKLYSVRVPLGGGKAKGVRLKNLSQSPWKVAAATVSDSVLSEKSIYSKIIAADEKYKEMVFNNEVVKSSALDFSWIQDAPAGKYGFAKPDGARIAFEKKPDADFKIYGNNLCFESNYPTHENAERLADTFARIGFNSVRFHHFDKPLVDPKSEGGVALDPDRIDKFDYLLAQMKSRGIYVTIDLYISRGLVKGVLEPEFEQYVQNVRSGSSAEIKSMFFFSENAMKNWEAFSANLLNHVNPYTGLAWKDEPAIISISLVNENTIAHCARSGARGLFLKNYAQWLEKNNLTDNANAPDSVMFARFLHEVYQRTYARQKEFLKNLGVKAMLTDQNFWSGTTLSLDQDKYDIVDTHYYFGHPRFLENPWSLPAELKNASSLRSVFSGIDKGAQQIADKPFYITEWNHVLNNDNAAEGAILMGAYGAMQNWSGFYRFTYSHGEIDFKPRSIAFFDSSSNPIAALSDRAASLFVLRGDVKKSSLVIPYLLARDTLTRGGKATASQLYSSPKLLQYLCAVGRVETKIYDGVSDVELPKSASFAVASEQGWIDAMKDKRVYRGWDYNDDLLAQALKNLGCDIEKKIFKSSTGELVMDQKTETLSVVTPKSEALIAPEGVKLRGEFARINCTKSRSVVLVSAIDRNTLEKSERILILHLSDVKNSNMKFSNDEMNVLESWGSTPILARAADATLTLYRGFDGYKLYALAPDGKRLGEVAMTSKKDDNKTVINMSTHSPYGIVFAYELVKE